MSATIEHGYQRRGQQGTRRPLLGLDPKDLVLLVLAFVVSSITLGTGRTYVMQVAVHLVIFASPLGGTMTPRQVLDVSATYVYDVLP